MLSKKGLKLLTLLFFIILSIQVLIIPVTSKNTNNDQVSYNVWTLKDWNEVNTTQWWSQGIYVNAKIGSNVIYNITNSQDNMTDPNSGYFSIGNVSKQMTDNADLASTFTLSIYPWSPGFVTNPTNWTENENIAKSAAATGYLQGSLSISNDISYNASGFLRVANEFTYMQNSSLGNQNTTLIYDKATGVLLYAKSEIFFSTLYKIELELQSSTLITSNNVPSTSKNTPGFTGIIPLVVLPIIYFTKKRMK